MQQDKIDFNERGLFAMLGQAITGSLGGWFILVSLFALVATVVMVYAGYQVFFVTHEEVTLIRWSVVLLLATMAQIALKMWTFMEMNRQSILREQARFKLAMLESLNERS